MKFPKIDWKWVAVFIIAGTITRMVLTYSQQHFTMPSGQAKATNCPDGTRTTTGHCLME